jgi:hypothetical protein
LDSADGKDVGRGALDQRSFLTSRHDEGIVSRINVSTPRMFSKVNNAKDRTAQTVGILALHQEFYPVVSELLVVLRNESLMLPKFDRLDRQFAEAFQSYIRDRSRSDSLLSQIKAHIIHEGRNTSIRRSATDEELTDMREASVETKISFEEIETIDVAQVLAKATEIAEQFQKKMSEHLFQTIDAVTEKTGLQDDARGMPLTNERLINLFSRMEMNFEHSDEGDLTIVTSPQMTSTFERLKREIDENPDIKKKWDAMKEAKRSEFREREINRDLAG